MRRNLRRKQKENKVITYSIAGVLLAITIIFGLVAYGNSINNQNQHEQLNSEQIASILDGSTDNKNVIDNDSKSASSSIGKSIEEEIELPKENKTVTKAPEKVEATTANVEKKTDVKKELEFQKPIEGEIMHEYAKEQLIFSETLQEWVTHTGIDIKAEKTAVVQAAEAGTIKSIKNDPRFGLTIVIEHDDGFETLYANLLSSEFVKEGEKVEKGQAIGTVGDTAVFESAEEPHLHFEILKDSTHVDPSIYLK